MNTEYFDALEIRSPEVREADLFERLPKLLAHAQTHSAGWATILEGHDAQSINSRERLAALPVTRKSDLKERQQNYPPLGALNATPLTDLAHLYLSPGPILDIDGSTNDWWRVARALFAAGVRRGNIIQNCFSYHFTPAAFMVETGARALGCPVVPAGVGQIDLQLEALTRLNVQAYCGTPSFLRIILERAAELHIKLPNLSRALMTAEALPPSLKNWFIDQGIAYPLQWYGTADLGLLAYESAHTQDQDGLIVEEQILFEIVKPGTNQPVPAGEVGEVVVTSFNADYPLIRFSTGDLSAILPDSLHTPAPCGRTNVRIKGWMGRADQAVKVRGMFVQPAQIALVIKKYPTVTRARLVVQGEMGQDRMTLYCEIQQNSVGLVSAIQQTIREVINLRAEVIFQGLGTLPNDGKVIEDLRDYR